MDARSAFLNWNVSIPPAHLLSCCEKRWHVDVPLDFSAVHDLINSKTWLFSPTQSFFIGYTPSHHQRALPLRDLFLYIHVTERQIQAVMWNIHPSQSHCQTHLVNVDLWPVLISARSDAAEKFTPAQEQQPVCPDAGHRPQCQHQQKQVSAPALSGPHESSLSVTSHILKLPATQVNGTLQYTRWTRGGSIYLLSGTFRPAASRQIPPSLVY